MAARSSEGRKTTDGAVFLHSESGDSYIYLIGDTSGSLFYRPYRTDLRDLRGSARHRTAEGNPDRASFTEDLHHDLSRPRAVVEVGKHDLLPAS